jgi:hypothetical protein
MTDAGAHSDPLAALPLLLESARELLAGSGARGDPAAEALLTHLQECVVAAHRLVLQRRLQTRSE